MNSKHIHYTVYSTHIHEQDKLEFTVDSANSSIWKHANQDYLFKNIKIGMNRKHKHNS